MHKVLLACLIGIVLGTAIFAPRRERSTTPSAAAAAAAQQVEGGSSARDASSASVAAAPAAAERTAPGRASARTPARTPTRGDRVAERPQPSGASDNGAAGRPGTVAAPAAEAPDIPPPTTLKLVDRMGRAVTLTVDENTEVLVLASWCPHSLALDGVLNDRRARPYIEGKKLVYVFDYDELRHHAAGAVRRGEITQAALDAYIARQPRGAVLSNPDFLGGLAANRVLYFDAKHPVDTDGYPSAFSGAPNVFKLNYGVWLARTLGHDLKVKLLDLYEGKS